MDKIGLYRHKSDSIFKNISLYFRERKFHPSGNKLTYYTNYYSASLHVCITETNKSLSSLKLNHKVFSSESFRFNFLFHFISELMIVRRQVGCGGGL